MSTETQFYKVLIERDSFNGVSLLNALQGAGFNYVNAASDTISCYSDEAGLRNADAASLPDLLDQSRTERIVLNGKVAGMDVGLYLDPGGVAEAQDIQRAESFDEVSFGAVSLAVPVFYLDILNTDEAEPRSNRLNQLFEVLCRVLKPAFGFAYHFDLWLEQRSSMHLHRQVRSLEPPPLFWMNFLRQEYEQALMERFGTDLWSKMGGKVKELGDLGSIVRFRQHAFQQHTTNVRYLS